MPKNLTYSVLRCRTGLGAAYGAAMRLLVLCCLFAMSGVLPCTLPASAQDTVEKEGEIEEKKNRPVTKGRIGFHFSRAGFVDDLPQYRNPIGAYYNIREDDIMPYPSLFFGIRYKNYEINIGWADDAINDVLTGNESVLRINARYNYYTTKNMYVYGGVIFWYFNKKFSYTNFICPDRSDPRLGCEGIMRLPVETGRPEGKHTIFGANLGTGVEYELWIFVLTHEFEFYISACSPDNFICQGVDFKFVGIHLPF